MTDHPDPGPSRARSALLFGLEWAGGALGLIIGIQLLGLLAASLFLPATGQPDSGTAVFLVGLRVLAAFLAVAAMLAAWRWARLAGRRRIVRRLRRHRWRIATVVAAFALVGFSATALRSQAPAWTSAKRPPVDCVVGDTKQQGRPAAPVLPGALKDPPVPGAAELAPTPCPGPR